MTEKQRKTARRVARLFEDVVMLYLMFAAVWSLCNVVSRLFAAWGIS